MILGEVVFASGNRILCELLLSTDRTVAVRDENGLIVIATRSQPSGDYTIGDVALVRFAAA